MSRVIWPGSIAPKRVRSDFDGQRLFRDAGGGRVRVLAMALDCWVMAQRLGAGGGAPFVVHALEFRELFTPAKAKGTLSPAATKPREASEGNTGTKEEPAIPAVNRGEG